MHEIHLVSGKNLKELLENALSGYHIEYLNIEDYSLTGKHKKTIVTGKIDIGYWNNEEYNEDIYNFEINIGTSKEELVLFDEYEVVIK